MQKAAALTILFSAAVSILLNLKIPFSYLSSLFSVSRPSVFLSQLSVFISQLSVFAEEEFLIFFYTGSVPGFSRLSHKLRQG